MCRIQLIVTGDLEKIALKSVLQRYFPSQRNGRDVEWLVPRMTAGATTTRLPSPTTVYGPMRELARVAIAELEVGRRGTPADLVVVVDDGEIGNIDQAANVTAHFRLAVNDVLNSRPTNLGSTARRLQRLRDSLSFHLLMPMVEAHFFTDQRALSACQVASHVPPLLANSDVEQFQCADPLWLPTCMTENARRAAHSPWWRHERHPKHYLEHLLERSGAGVYEETSDAAVAALHAANWGAHAATDGQFARSLFQDLADWFGVPNPMGTGSCAAETWPGTTTRAATLLLRNF